MQLRFICMRLPAIWPTKPCLRQCLNLAKLGTCRRILKICLRLQRLPHIVCRSGRGSPIKSCTSDQACNIIDIEGAYMKNIAHLHVHTDASQDGLSQVENLVEKA